MDGDLGAGGGGGEYVELVERRLALPDEERQVPAMQRLRRQQLCVCTSKASKLSTGTQASRKRCGSRTLSSPPLPPPSSSLPLPPAPCCCWRLALAVEVMCASWCELEGRGRRREGRRRRGTEERWRWRHAGQTGGSKPRANSLPLPHVKPRANSPPAAPQVSVFVRLY